MTEIDQGKLDRLWDARNRGSGLDALARELSEMIKDDGVIIDKLFSTKDSMHSINFLVDIIENVPHRVLDLQFRDNAFNLEDFTKIAKAVLRLINQDPSIQIALNLDRNVIGHKNDTTLDQDVHNLLMSQKFVGLSLSRNYLDDAFIQQINFDIMESSLLALDLSDNNISAKGLKHIREHIIEKAHLTTLNLGGNGLRTFIPKQDITPFITNNHLKNLDLSACGIHCHTMHFIIQAIANNETITALNIANNHLEKPQLSTLANILSNQKSIVDFKFFGVNTHNIDNKILSELINALKTNRTLTSTDFVRQGFALDNKKMDDFEQMLNNNKQLLDITPNIGFINAWQYGQRSVIENLLSMNGYKQPLTFPLAVEMLEAYTDEFIRGVGEGELKRNSYLNLVSRIQLKKSDAMVLLDLENIFNAGPQNQIVKSDFTFLHFLCLLRQNKVNDACTKFGEYKELIDRSDDKYVIAERNYGIAQLMHSLGKYSTAVKAYYKGLAVFDNVTFLCDQKHLIFLLGVGNTLKSMSSFELARKYYKLILSHTVTASSGQKQLQELKKVAYEAIESIDSYAFFKANNNDNFKAQDSVDDSLFRLIEAEAINIDYIREYFQNCALKNNLSQDQYIRYNAIVSKIVWGQELIGVTANFGSAFTRDDMCFNALKKQIEDLQLLQLMIASWNFESPEEITAQTTAYALIDDLENYYKSFIDRTVLYNKKPDENNKVKLTLDKPSHSGAPNHEKYLKHDIKERLVIEPFLDGFWKKGIISEDASKQRYIISHNDVRYEYDPKLTHIEYALTILHNKLFAENQIPPPVLLSLYTTVEKKTAYYCATKKIGEYHLSDIISNNPYLLKLLDIESFSILFVFSLITGIGDVKAQDINVELIKNSQDEIIHVKMRLMDVNIAFCKGALGIVYEKDPQLLQQVNEFAAISNVLFFLAQMDYPISAKIFSSFQDPEQLMVALLEILQERHAPFPSFNEPAYTEGMFAKIYKNLKKISKWVNKNPYITHQEILQKFYSQEISQKCKEIRSDPDMLHKMHLYHHTNPLLFNKEQQEYQALRHVVMQEIDVKCYEKHNQARNHQEKISSVISAETEKYISSIDFGALSREDVQNILCTKLQSLKFVKTLELHNINHTQLKAIFFNNSVFSATHCNKLIIHKSTIENAEYEVIKRIIDDKNGPNTISLQQCYCFQEEVSEKLNKLSAPHSAKIKVELVDNNSGRNNNEQNAGQDEREEGFLERLFTNLNEDNINAIAEYFLFEDARQELQCNILVGNETRSILEATYKEPKLQEVLCILLQRLESKYLLEQCKDHHLLYSLVEYCSNPATLTTLLTRLQQEAEDDEMSYLLTTKRAKFGTICEYALKQHKLPFAALLLNYKAKVSDDILNKHLSKNYQLVIKAAQYGIIVDAQDFATCFDLSKTDVNGNYLIHLACAYGNFELFKDIITQTAYGDTMWALNVNNQNALDLAQQYVLGTPGVYAKVEDVQIIQFIFNNIYASIYEGTSRYPAFATSKHKAFAEFDALHPDKELRKYYCKDGCHWFLKLKANVTAENLELSKIFCQMGMRLRLEDVIKCMNVNVVNEKGNTILYEIIKQMAFDPELFTLLEKVICYGSDITKTERLDGMTPLHLAVSANHLFVVKKLLEHDRGGEAVNQSNSAGKKPYDIALERQNQHLQDSQIGKMLLEAQQHQPQQHQQQQEGVDMMGADNAH